MKNLFVLIFCLISIECHSQSRIYSFHGLIGKPISYYKIWDKKFHELSFIDVGYAEAHKFWEGIEFSIKDITIKCYLDSAIISFDTGKIINHNLDRKNNQFYEGKSSKGTTYILKCISEEYCQLFIVIGNNVLSIENKSILQK